jgi:lipid A 3-O-deacylase
MSASTLPAMLVAACVLGGTAQPEPAPVSQPDDAAVLEYVGCLPTVSHEMTTSQCEVMAEDDAWAPARWSVEVLTGAYFVPSHFGPHKTPTFDLEATDVRLGYVLCGPIWEGTVLRGDWEVLLEATTAAVLRGPGNIVVGPSALVRRNFAEEGSPQTIYVQAGAGIVYNDAYRDLQQRAIGQADEFYLSVAVGYRYALSCQWALEAELGYVHISNADLAPRNGGINALGASVGLVYSFR